MRLFFFNLMKGSIAHKYMVIVNCAVNIGIDELKV